MNSILIGYWRPSVEGLAKSRATIQLSNSLLAVMLTLTTGCVLPHCEVRAPRADGVVMDSEFLLPIGDAVVTRHNETLERLSFTTTDDEGRFAFSKDRDLHWFAGAALVACRISYHVEAPGYSAFCTNKLAHGEPHNLGEILLPSER